MPRAIPRLLLLAALALAPRLLAQEIELQPFRPQEDIAQDPEAARAFSSFSRAWSRTDAGGVAELVPPDGRVSLTIEERGVSGQMSRGQVETVLGGFFSEVGRATFALRDPIQLTGETSAYAVGDWRYQARRPERRRHETVFVVFRQSQTGDWGLSELVVQPVR